MECIKCWYCKRMAEVTQENGTRRYMMICPKCGPYPKTQRELEVHAENLRVNIKSA